MIRPLRNLRRLLLGTVTFVVPVTVTFIDLVGCVVKVEGISMQPALNPLGDGRSAVDYVFLNRWAASAYHFQRGEIVSLRSPSNPDQNLIKRIVALEGDLVRTLAYKEAVVHVPSGHCWVEGDHHKNSMDSNFFGPVSLGLISAKASHIVWPPSRWQRLRVQASEDHRVNSLDTFLEC
ncbi:mitochondrial inner membrane protease subunit 2-like [Haliotis cracherodii]|uniref:mitochondrial inner membrane protease subunit 2-like n=1 Tax=Haliotis rufescens TaxID=6454 RepID=UPI00201F0876|nr:mitochondrial inner membrane protease subunit 2-like [Haliotis rufescens]XP_048252868.1 mitochondrial inner membrane protease subunit 2-like [Haliotis rufescens]XP_048252869.1 mitochondrial inner membrane protease subunit 2-like [Haliotis rufescens]